jgi:hypothetical protein
MQNHENKGQNFLFETGQETPVTMLRTIEAIGTDNLGINFDTANLMLYGKGTRLTRLTCSENTSNTHIKDGFYPTDGMKLGRQVPVGEGKANIPAVVRRLEENRILRRVHNRAGNKGRTADQGHHRRKKLPARNLRRNRQNKSIRRMKIKSTANKRGAFYLALFMLIVCYVKQLLFSVFSLLEAGAAINRSVIGRLEDNLGNSAAVGAGRLEVFFRCLSGISLVVSAIFAAFRFVQKAFSAKNFFSPAVNTNSAPQSLQTSVSSTKFSATPTFTF